MPGWPTVGRGKTAAALAMAASLPLVMGPSLAVGQASRQGGVGQWRGYIDEAAQRFDLSPTLIADVMRAESAGVASSDGAPTRSKAGAIGLMQLMPATFEAMRRAHSLEDQISDPRQNILAGAAYLNQMRRRFGYPGLLAAYNAGPAALEAHLSSRRALPTETRLYLRRLGVWEAFVAWANERQRQGVSDPGSGSGLGSDATPAGRPALLFALGAQSAARMMVSPQPVEAMWAIAPARSYSPVPGQVDLGAGDGQR